MVKTNRSVQKSGIRAKRGKTGKTANYITRQKALRKLQLPLKDFRRLCILKGVFPRELPGHHKKDKSKIYYHVKDINYMQHERILQQYRDLKVFLRKRKKLHGRYEHDEAKRLQKPVIKLDHLVRERYPSIADALRDMDDPLSMLFLFNTLRVKVHSSFSETDSAMAARLIAEWKTYIQTAFALRKVFVSIKGYYYQAQVAGQTITWLVPHQAMQNTPQNVDYDVMTTFLQFYLTMVRCINYKLFKDLNITYPVPTESEEEKAEAFFAARAPTSNNNNNNNNKNIENKKTIAPTTTQNSKTLSKKQLSTAMQSETGNAGDEGEDNQEQEDNTNEFQQLDPSLQLVDDETEKCKNLFANCIFLVGRECAFDPIAFVIRSAGGVAIRESALPNPTLANSALFTHQIIDRPIVAAQFKPIINRRYVQPQWIFDSFNMRGVLPIEPYAPGSSLPPHLSPFVDDVKENYVPEQRNQLRAWVGLPPLKQSVLARIEQQQKKTDEQIEQEEEAQYAQELAQERKSGAQKKQQQQQPDIDLDLGGGDDDMLMSDGEDEDVEVDDVSESDFDENEYMKDSDDEEEDNDMDIEEKKVAQKAKPAPKPSSFNPRDNDKQLAKIMMPKKDKRLHNRMMFGINEKKKVAQNLADKAVGEKPQNIGSGLRRKR